MGTFLYAMGDCADDIVKTVSINEATAKQPLPLTKSKQPSMVILQPAAILSLNRRRQNPGESVDTFIQDLYRLAENCEYGTRRDRIIVGVLGDTLSDRLQAKSDPTLVDAARMSIQSEARKQNRTVVRGVETQNVVDYVSQETLNCL